jgi:hypothetical protein
MAQQSRRRFGCAQRQRGAIFRALPTASIGHFAPRGFRFENGAVTVLSRNDGAFSLILSERA